jgi:hypothetical protein
MASEQSYATHRRYFPWHHYFVVPVLGINLIVEITRALNDPGRYRWWLVVVALALFFFSFTARAMSLRAQDRVIRLEERLRLFRLLPPIDQPVVDSLKPGQLVALRFASDDEVPDLVRRITAGELASTTEIKKAIRMWRPDYLRV